MDFKINRIGWVGGICQKFETLCHEVDNIVNQDTLKYVENRAQTVGRSVKRFYSDVIHDMMPPSNHEGLGATLTITTVDADAKSEADIEENHIETVVDPFAEQFNHVSNELHLSDQISTSTAVDAPEDAESSKLLEQISDVSKNTRSDVSAEHSIVGKVTGSEALELISTSEETFIGASLNNDFASFDDKSSYAVMGELPLTMSVHDMEFHSTKIEETIDKNIEDDVVGKQVECSFSELCLVDQLGSPNSVTVDCPLETESVTSGQAPDALKDIKSEAKIEDDSTIEKPSAFEVLDNISHAEKECSGASSLTESTDFNVKETCREEAKVCPSISVHDAGMPYAPDVSELISEGEEEPFAVSSMYQFVKYNDKSSCGVCLDVSLATLIHDDQNAKTVNNDFVGNSEYDGDAAGQTTSSKVICCKENMAESMHSFSFLNPLLSNDKKLTAEVSIPFSNDVSAASRETDASKTVNTAGSYFNDVSIASHETDASKTINTTESLTGILGNKNVYSGVESSQLQAFWSPDTGPEDESDDISLENMETIELCDNVKLEDSCVFIDSTALCAVSRIMRKHRSYKKMIQDALNSKKRLAKEYEQLAIWFGDADMGSSQDSSQTQRLRPSTSTTSGCKIPELCDSEWELL